MGGEITAARPFPDLGLQERNQKAAREMRHPATGEEVALVGNVEDNGSGG